MCVPVRLRPLEALNVLNVRLVTDGEARSLKPAHAELVCRNIDSVVSNA
jgi:hypothetical protein